MTNGVNRLTLLILLALLFATNTSCSLTKGKGIAEAAVVKFHNQYNAEQFHEIYNQADGGFKKEVNEAEFISLLEAVRRKLGTMKQANPAGWGINATTMGTMATLSYEIEFSEGKGQEQFVFHVSGDKALLYHYNVNSPLLITK
jgi:serine protease inhibitor ecotin